jgi:hypothetical protein
LKKLEETWAGLELTVTPHMEEILPKKDLYTRFWGNTQELKAPLYMEEDEPSLVCRSNGLLFTPYF